MQDIEEGTFLHDCTTYVRRSNEVKSTESFVKKLGVVLEKLKERYGYEGDAEDLFLWLLDLAGKKTELLDFLRENGIDERELLETLKRVKDLMRDLGIPEEKALGVFLEEARRGNLVPVEEKILERLKKENASGILRSGKSPYGAVAGLVNDVLRSCPKEADFYRTLSFLALAKKCEPEDVLWALLQEEKQREEQGVEYVPVPADLWRELSEVSSSLPKVYREKLKNDLVRRIEKALSSTLREAKQLQKKLEKKKKG